MAVTVRWIKRSNWFNTIYNIDSISWALMVSASFLWNCSKEKCIVSQLQTRRLLFTHDIVSTSFILERDILNKRPNFKHISVCQLQKNELISESSSYKHDDYVIDIVSISVSCKRKWCRIHQNKNRIFKNHMTQKYF